MRTENSLKKKKKKEVRTNLVIIRMREQRRVSTSNITSCSFKFELHRNSKGQKIYESGYFSCCFLIKHLELTFSKVRLIKEIIFIHIKCWRNFTSIISFKFYNKAVNMCQLSRYTFNTTKQKHEVVNYSQEGSNKCQDFLSQSPGQHSAF